MCLYPRLIKNRKYTVTKKNGGNVPPVTDPRTQYVPIGCQQCMECKKQKARNWSVRLQEEIRTNQSGQFVTLTFSNESIKNLLRDIPEGLEGYELDNELATVAVRRFLERWRKHNKTSVKHWLVTELGSNGTENIHLHGIIFHQDKEEIKKRWEYGFVFIGDYVNDQTINYICKYVNKTDKKHPEYQSKILTSPGIGEGYTRRADAKTNKFIKGKTVETYTTRQGTKLNLPIYYRNKIYTEEEREKLWIEKLDKNIRWVGGEKVDLNKINIEKFYKLLKYYQGKNIRLGYGTGEINWNRRQYENERRKMLQEKRVCETQT